MVLGYVTFLFLTVKKCLMFIFDLIFISLKMSAAFKNSKKKVSQSELRKFMNEHKTKKDVKKIESPLAKYNDQGELTCVLCKSIVRSEAVWTVHVNAKVHKQNVEIAKKLKERTNNFTIPLKRPLTPPTIDTPKKKIKGILKNTNNDKDVSNTNNISGSRLPDDFFDASETQKISITENKKSDTKHEIMEIEDILESRDVLPEGFFDDPKLDAKARNQEYKDPVEEEWEKFVKAIKEADSESNAIIAEDQEEATTERQIVEIDEQMKKLSRVLDLEKKKIEIISTSSDIKKLKINERDEEDLDDNFDEFLDWRAKKSFK